MIFNIHSHLCRYVAARTYLRIDGRVDVLNTRMDLMKELFVRLIAPYTIAPYIIAPCPLPPAVRRVTAPAAPRVDRGQIMRIDLLPPVRLRVHALARTYCSDKRPAAISSCPHVCLWLAISSCTLYAWTCRSCCTTSLIRSTARFWSGSSSSSLWWRLWSRWASGPGSSTSTNTEGRYFSTIVNNPQTN